MSYQSSGTLGKYLAKKLINYVNMSQSVIWQQVKTIWRWKCSMFFTQIQEKQQIFMLYISHIDEYTNHMAAKNHWNINETHLPIL